MKKKSVKATVASQDFAAFLDRLETIGKLQWEKDSVAAPEEKTTVSIFILDHP